MQFVLKIKWFESIDSHMNEQTCIAQSSYTQQNILHVHVWVQLSQCNFHHNVKANNL